MPGPVYGLATLKVPPAGLPERFTGNPRHPFTLEAVTTGKLLMVIVIPFDVAVEGFAHVAVEVITQVTVCVLVRLLVENVALFVPALTPFTFH